VNKNIEYINPDGLIKNPAFSQIAVIQGNGKTIYIGGQNSVNSNREIIGKGDIEKQTAQVLLNIQTALISVGATPENIVKISIAVIPGQNLNKAFQVYQKFMSDVIIRPAISVHIVAALANPDFLIEIEAIAFVSG
jgi:enamine deaminase RidA (YjgF/YER057c/UK114 family)